MASQVLFGFSYIFPELSMPCFYLILGLFEGDIAESSSLNGNGGGDLLLLISLSSRSYSDLILKRSCSQTLDNFYGLADFYCCLIIDKKTCSYSPMHLSCLFERVLYVKNSDLQALSFFSRSLIPNSYQSCISTKGYVVLRCEMSFNFSTLARNQDIQSSVDGATYIPLLTVDACYIFFGDAS